MAIVFAPFPEVLVCAVAEGGDDRERLPGRRRFLPSRMTAPSPVPPPAGDRAAIDAQLLARVARGDRQAFAELYDRFSTPLYATALRIVCDATEAQDIVHDAFVTIWEKAAVFDLARGSAFSWAVTLVRNRAIDRVRTRRRRAELLADSAPSDLGYQEGGHAASADTTTLQGDDARVVRAAVATLPPDQQRVLELAFFGGLTQEQIAEKLQAPLGTVKARIRRGLLKLRDSLAQRP
jgi:RNA polymerase sigma-70 factor (ECF subfamily)